MFASLGFLLAAQQISIPLGTPPPAVEAPRAPIQTAGPLFAAECKDSEEWDKPAPPVRIHGNTYLVGTCGISSILITGNAGHVLIDGGTEAGADLIAENILRLGFRLTDVRYLLMSHEHHDHVGGLARLQKLTGAQLIASAAAAPVLNSGAAGPGDPQAGMNPPFPAAHVDRIVKEDEMVRIGNTVLTAVSTPGHTPGALTWHWGSCDGGVCRQIVYADSLTAISRDDYRFSDHPAYVAAFRAGLRKLAALPGDILLTPHPSASDMVKRLARADMTDPGACQAYAAKAEKALNERLAKEAAKK